uniref:Uncharacterized protein n=1 Tax=Molossus molossus TaxID=27622 RepID=A0A7J8DPP7_MOLMO|nr:hypothetical protein HJG59_009252 [Molossus molossus]
MRRKLAPHRELPAFQGRDLAGSRADPPGAGLGSAQFSGGAICRANVIKRGKPSRDALASTGLRGAGSPGTSEMSWGLSPWPSLNPEAPEKSCSPAPPPIFSDEETEAQKGVVASQGPQRSRESHSFLPGTPPCPLCLLCRKLKCFRSTTASTTSEIWRQPVLSRADRVGVRAHQHPMRSNHA